MTAATKIPIGGHGFPVDGQLRSRSAASLSLTVSAGWGEKQLPRRLRYSGLAALRSAVGLPPDLPVVLQSAAEKDG